MPSQFMKFWYLYQYGIWSNKITAFCVQLFQNFIPPIEGSVDPDQLASDEAS